MCSTRLPQTCIPDPMTRLFVSPSNKYARHNRASIGGRTPKLLFFLRPGSGSRWIRSFWGRWCVEWASRVDLIADYSIPMQTPQQPNCEHQQDHQMDINHSLGRKETDSKYQSDKSTICKEENVGGSALRKYSQKQIFEGGFGWGSHPEVIATQGDQGAIA